MGNAYADLLTDRSALRWVQLQAYVACQDRTSARWSARASGDWTGFVADASGADADTVRRFFETGMLMNVVAAMELDRVNEPWARDLMVLKKGVK